MVVGVFMQLAFLKKRTAALKFTLCNFCRTK